MKISRQISRIIGVKVLSIDMAELFVNAGSKEICKTGIFLSMSVWQVETCMINERGKTCPLHSLHTYVEIPRLKNDKKKKIQTPCAC